jgi:predicted ATPase
MSGLEGSGELIGRFQGEPHAAIGHGTVFDYAGGAPHGFILARLPPYNGAVLTAVAIANYRSLRNSVVPLHRLNIVTGANGSGKSSFYRALRLLGDTAQGRVVSSLAREGGLQSTLWAGPETIARSVRRQEFEVEGTRKKQPVNLRLGFASDELGYSIDLGLPKPERDPDHPERLRPFSHDPEIKRECIWHGPLLRPAAMLVDRNGPLVRLRGEDGEWNVAIKNLAAFDSMMTHVSDPRGAPETLVLRESIRAWRFYDHFRTDVDAPARQSHIGTRTPILANDGADVAAAIETIREIGDANALDAAVSDAFPRSEVSVTHAEGRFSLSMTQHGLLRALETAELSDGTLRYLLWIAALLTPRPPALMVLNEPETSLHPDLLAPLGRLIAAAAERSQLIVVTHAAALIAALREHGGNPITLEKSFGESIRRPDVELALALVLHAVGAPAVDAMAIVTRGVQLIGGFADGLLIAALRRLVGGLTCVQKLVGEFDPIRVG